MNKNIDDRIVELIKKNENISNKEISRIIGIPEKEVETRIRGFSDSREKIMIVDDEMATLLPLKRSLEAQGYIVIEAYDGYQAIEKSKTERARIDSP